MFEEFDIFLNNELFELFQVCSIFVLDTFHVIYCHLVKLFYHINSFCDVVFDFIDFEFGLFVLYFVFATIFGQFLNLTFQTIAPILLLEFCLEFVLLICVEKTDIM